MIDRRRQRENKGEPGEFKKLAVDPRLGHVNANDRL